MSSIGTFYIRVEDENDNAPYFYYPKETSRFISIKFPLLTNTSFSRSVFLKLINVKAFDDDLDDNGRINYFLEGGGNFLQIDKLNGSLYFDYSNVTYEKFNKFKKILNISIVARDCGTPSLSSAVNLTLFLNYDSNELPEYVYNRLQNENTQKVKSNFMLDSMRKSEKIAAYSVSKPSRNNSGGVSILQLILSNFLLIFLMVILFIMMFITCFVFLTIYRRGLVDGGGEDSKKNQHMKNKPTDFNSLNAKLNGKKGRIVKCVSNVKRYFKSDCVLATNKSFKNLSSGSSSQHENLTVSD